MEFLVVTTGLCLFGGRVFLGGLGRFAVALPIVAAIGLAPAPARAQAPDTPLELIPNECERESLDCIAAWTGDLDGMIERRMIRVLTVPNRTNYFVDRGQQRGITYEIFKALEDELNKTLKLGARKLHVVFVPVRRDRLIPGLVEGLGDVAASNLTITEARAELIDFTDPFFTGVKEVLVTGPASEPIAAIEELAGREVVVRKSSSYYESLTALNERFAAEGKTPMTLTLAAEELEDEDLMEMVGAGIYPAIVVDDHKAKLWAEVLGNLTIHEDIALREGGSIAWAIRKDSPKLMAELNAFAKTHKKGTEFGNIMLKRYFKNTKYLKNNVDEAELKKFREVIELLKKYAADYEFDWLLIAAQAYQESGIDQSVKSPVGAVGVMQVLPTTAEAEPIGLKDVETDIDSNVHAGVKYLRFMINQYFDDPAISPVNRMLLAFAGYNAGPNRIDRLRKKAAEQGLDPNVWFGNVELVVAEQVGRETTQYVGNINKYYLAYRRLLDQAAAKETAKSETEAEE
jgi:membrane-bound lytic murein transglycosylase MltF